MLPLAQALRPLPHELPLARVLRLLPAGGPIGVWLRHCQRPFTMILGGARPGVRLRCDADLGRLLRCAPAVLVRQGSTVRVVHADQLRSSRTLRVLAAPPAAPSLEALHRLFPESHIETGALDVPLRNRSAEEILAACAHAGVPVVRTQVVYPLPRSSPGVRSRSR